MNCPLCDLGVKITNKGTWYVHKDASTGERCDASGTVAEALPFVRPDDPFTAAPRVIRAVADVQPMSELGLEIASRFKELFHAYTNRSERTVQDHLGPSEAGSPCDRRLAMSLMRRPHVNPGSDNWASFIGTCVHQGLAHMFMWGDANTGRYAVEVPLRFPSVIMPKGTGDLLDRVLLAFIDHKIMGRWSLDKLRTEGPIPLYRTQVHLYAYAARKSGENIERVALAAWPREGSNLDDLYVWEEPYDPTVPRDALARLDRIKTDVDKGWEPALFDADDDCRYCPFHAPGDDSFQRGCPGR